MPLPEELLEATIGKGKRLVISDVETNGLLPGMSTDGHPPMDTIHCATAEDYHSGESFAWTPDTIKRYPEWMMDEVGVVVGHNFINFDNAAIQFVYPEYDPTRLITLDSLVLCKMIWPADVLIGPDMKLYRAGKMPGNLLKRQSLAAWGHRLGNHKGDYKGGWDKWSQSMQDYMVQDGKVNLDLWKLILRRLGWQGTSETSATKGSPPASSSPKNSSEQQRPQETPRGPSGYVWPWMPIWIEMEIQKIISEQEAVGVGFNYQKAVALSQDLKNRQEDMTDGLRSIFKPWWQPLDDPKKGRKVNREVVRQRKDQPTLHGSNASFAAKRYAALKGLKKAPNFEGGFQREYYFEGSVYVRLVYTEFNPRSRDHLTDRLQRVYGWKPDVFTPNGKPQADESVIENISSKVIDKETRKLLMDNMVVTKTLGQLTDGPKSWLNLVSPLDGAIHGRCDPLGTITHRATHFNPNMNVPAVDVDDDGHPIVDIEGRFGAECRELFQASGLSPNSPEWRKPMVEMTGSDIKGLEFVMLGHYLEPFDGGEFRDRASDPDADLHAEHAKRATEAGNPTTRREAKTLGFLIIYGGGALKAGKDLKVEEDEIGLLLQDKGLPNRLRFMKKRMGRAYEEPTDLDKARIVKGARGIKAIKDAIPGLQELMDDAKEEAETYGYIIAIDGRKLVTRKPYAALNTRLQGGGSIVCKLWQILLHQKARAHGLRLRFDYNQVLWVHDETQKEHRKGLGALLAKLDAEAAAEAAVMLNIKGTFRTDSKTGSNWKECH